MMSVYDDRIPTVESDPIEYSICPACGSPIDYCQGHGMYADPHGYRICQLHDEDYHGNCHSASHCHDIWGD